MHSQLSMKQAFEVNTKIGSRTIDAIPNFYDIVMTVSMCDPRFIDLFQCMAPSLKQLVEHIYDKDDKITPISFMKQNYPEQIDLQGQKGFYP